MDKFIYPDTLEPHKKTETFNLDDKTFQLRDKLAYYHDDEFPLLMHSHDFYEVNIIVSGVGRHYIRNNHFPASPGDVFAIPPGVEHGYYAYNNSMSIFHLLLDKKILEKYSSEIRQFSAFYLLFETEPSIRTSAKNLSSVYLHLNEEQMLKYKPWMNYLIDAATKHPNDPGYIFDHLAISFTFTLANLFNEYFHSKPADAHNDIAHGLILSVEYMRKNMGSKISIDDLAKTAAFSRSHYLKRFKEVFGTSPIEYLQKLRINHAMELLQSTDYSVTTIAQQCGFFDCSHLTSTFKEELGMTPSEFRKK